MKWCLEGWGQVMWRQLWCDFAARTTRLSEDATPVDAVDETILWQVHGTGPWVRARIPWASLHLPELCSGAPWDLCDIPQLTGWVAFVTINPSIEPDEIYPNRTDLGRIQYDALRAFFAQRFEPGPVDVGGLRRGRDRSGRIRVWLNPRNQPTAKGQPTWARINNALSRSLQMRGFTTRAPLGRIGAIIDAVPWKFAKWATGNVPRAPLIEAGAPYLAWTLNTYMPSAVVAAGQDAYRALLAGFPDYLPEYGAGIVQRGAIALGDRRVPVFRLSAPTAHGGAFSDGWTTICVEVLDALGLRS